MIVKIPLLLALCVCIKDVASASFSKVFVQSGLDYPVEYVQYGAPSVSYSPQIAQLTAAPVGSVVPYSSNYVPCGTPCIYPGQVASIAPSANIIQYQAPSLPVVVAPSRSAQRELSDGSVVRGGYSFLQPDGFVREVKYEADDLRGFNAVVKNYVPVSVETKHDQAEKEPAPCPDIKNEHLTHESPVEKPEKTEESHEEPSHESHPTEPSHENLKADTPNEQEVNHEEHSESIELHEQPHEEHHETHEEHHELHEEPHEEHHETHEEHHEEPDKELLEVHEEHEATPEAHEGIVEESHEGHVQPIENESHEEQPKEELSHESHIEAEAHENHENNIAVAENSIENSNILVPYNDIIKCVQAAINGAKEVSSPHKAESPLTYIILNKPC
ncbi:putative cuticle protein [Operophtera brumata]|uniref:Putative cuticle protein n=1 Tax=Operophtera brumata TaxID=104452 RepID=A0A0L7LPK7_OPEBR|nr:putative cuticle protein [Operophtera brumata]